MTRMRHAANNRAHHHDVGNKGKTLADPLLGKAKSRPCPKCDAQPGWSCRRWVGAKVGGEDIGGGYFRPLKKVHAERHRPKAPKGLDDKP